MLAAAYGALLNHVLFQVVDATVTAIALITMIAVLTFLLL